MSAMFFVTFIILVTMVTGRALSAPATNQPTVDNNGNGEATINWVNSSADCKTSGQCPGDGELVTVLMNALNRQSQQSACRWSYTYNCDATRQPSMLPIAVCVNNSTTDGQLCEPILYPITVRIQQEPDGPWVSHVELVSVGCAEKSVNQRSDEQRRNGAAITGVPGPDNNKHKEATVTDGTPGSDYEEAFTPIPGPVVEDD